VVKKRSRRKPEKDAIVLVRRPRGTLTKRNRLIEKEKPDLGVEKTICRSSAARGAGEGTFGTASSKKAPLCEGKKFSRKALVSAHET